MNNAEFYLEMERRRTIAIKLAIVQYPHIDRRFITVTFFPDAVYVGIYDTDNVFVENFIIDSELTPTAIG